MTWNSWRHFCMWFGLDTNTYHTFKLFVEKWKLHISILYYPTVSCKIQIKYWKSVEILIWMFKSSKHMNTLCCLQPVSINFCNYFPWLKEEMHLLCFEFISSSAMFGHNVLHHFPIQVYSWKVLLAETVQSSCIHCNILNTCISIVVFVWHAAGCNKPKPCFWDHQRGLLTVFSS